MDFRGEPGLKTGVKNDNFWSKIGSAFGEPGGTPPTKNSRETPPPSPPLGPRPKGRKNYNFMLPKQDNPFPVNPALQVQLKEPTVF